MEKNPLPMKVFNRSKAVFKKLLYNFICILKDMSLVQSLEFIFY